jgi:hypothetical protein
METTHVCMKTYYVRTRTGYIRPITTMAFICQKMRTDLSSVKGQGYSVGYSVVHHPDPDESRIYPLIKGKARQTSCNLLHLRVSTQFFDYLNAELMSAQQFGETRGYEKWHRRLGHT